jgi:outer membrane lipoprotein LolB
LSKRLTPPPLAVLLFVVLAAGCRAVPLAGPADRAAQDAYRARSDELSAWTAWEMRGRLSIDDGREGGSGRLAWRTQDRFSRLDFRGTLGQGAWRLQISDSRAVLERADGSQAEASSVEVLVQQELGWQVPVDALRHWVLGMQAPGPVARVDLDELGRVTHLEQDGWSIELGRYRQAEGVDVPGRIEAARGELRIKLIATSWTRLEPEPEGA